MDRSSALASLALLALAVLAAPLRDARADSTAPPEYTVTVDGTTVTVCPPDLNGTDPNPFAACDDGSPMLRVNETTGEVVELPQRCNCGCFVDLCVPPGSYEYGLEAAPTCEGMPGAELPYYGAAMVVASSATCAPSDGDMPTPFAGPAPWPPDSGYLTCPGGGGCGCDLSRRGEPAHAVLAVQALALLVGVTLMRRRRRLAR
jgi:hypothetical protein